MFLISADDSTKQNETERNPARRIIVSRRVRTRTLEYTIRTSVYTHTHAVIQCKTAAIHCELAACLCRSRRCKGER